VKFTGKKGFALIVTSGEAEIAQYRRDPGEEWMVVTRRSPIWLRDYDDDLDIHFEGTPKGGVSDAIHVIAVADKANALPDPATIKVADKETQAELAKAIQSEIARSQLSNVMKAHATDLFCEHHIGATSYRAFSKSKNFEEAAVLSLKVVAVREGLMLQGMHDKIEKTLGGLPFRFG
jgi:hypothetical protein